MRGDAQTALLAGYGLLAFAAVGRSTYELFTKFSDAPVAYSLSTLAAVVYLVALWAIARADALGIRVARIACTFELVGVLLVGALSLLNTGLFTEATVWSQFGIGYGFLPLIMPILALWWLARHDDADKLAGP